MDVNQQLPNIDPPPKKEAYLFSPAAFRYPLISPVSLSLPTPKKGKLTPWDLDAARVSLEMSYYKDVQICGQFSALLRRRGSLTEMTAPLHWYRFGPETAACGFSGVEISERRIASTAFMCAFDSGSGLL